MLYSKRKVSVIHDGNEQMNVRKKVTALKPVQLIVLSFVAVIFTGACLLMLPISNQDGNWFSFIDALFTATSATCVTGLVVVPTATQFTLFGQIVIILLIQIGGLGLVSIVAVIIVLTSKKLMQSEKIAITEAVNADSQFQIGRFLKFIIAFVFLTELVGAVLLAIRFVPMMGVAQGIYQAVFTSISAFCNAGFDILGTNSLALFSKDWFLSIIVSSLIIFGGLGFGVWADLYKHIRAFFKKEESIIKAKKAIRIHTKLVIKATLFLLVLGTVLYFLSEYNNPLTLGTYSLPDKIVASFFQSATLRTAGFYTIDFGDTHLFTKLFSSILMFIGGSPGGTAGGIKTTTFMVLILLIISEVKGRKDLVFSKRTISKETIQRCFSILTLALMFFLAGILILSLTEQADLIDIVFEVASALGTVGLTTGLTPLLTWVGKLVILLLMFIGRIGPIAVVLSLAFRNNKHQSKNDITYPDAHILVG